MGNTESGADAQRPPAGAHVPLSFGVCLTRLLIHAFSYSLINIIIQFDESVVDELAARKRARVAAGNNIYNLDLAITGALE